MDQELVGDAAYVYAPCALTRWQHFPAWNNVKCPTPSIDTYLLEEQSCPKFHLDPIWNDTAFWRGRLNKKNNKKNKMSNDTSSVPDPKSEKRGKRNLGWPN